MYMPITRDPMSGGEGVAEHAVVPAYAAPCHLSRWRRCQVPACGVRRQQQCSHRCSVAKARSGMRKARTRVRNAAQR